MGLSDGQKKTHGSHRDRRHLQLTRQYHHPSLLHIASIPPLQGLPVFTLRWCRLPLFCLCVSSVSLFVLGDVNCSFPLWPILFCLLFLCAISACVCLCHARSMLAYF